MKMQLIDYFDVWGNKNDGWEVNDMARLDILVDVTDSTTNDDIALALHEEGYLISTDADPFDIQSDGGMIEFFDKKNRYPLFRLEEVFE